MSKERFQFESRLLLYFLSMAGTVARSVGASSVRYLQEEVSPSVPIELYRPGQYEHSAANSIGSAGISGSGALSNAVTFANSPLNHNVNYSSDGVLQFNVTLPGRTSEQQYQIRGLEPVAGSHNRFRVNSSYQDPEFQRLYPDSHEFLRTVLGVSGLNNDGTILNEHGIRLALRNYGEKLSNIVTAVPPGHSDVMSIQEGAVVASAHSSISGVREPIDLTVTGGGVALSGNAGTTSDGLAGDLTLFRSNLSKYIPNSGVRLLGEYGGTVATTTRFGNYSNLVTVSGGNSNVEYSQNGDSANPVSVTMSSVHQQNSERFGVPALSSATLRHGTISRASQAFDLLPLTHSSRYSSITINGAAKDFTIRAGQSMVFQWGIGSDIAGTSFTLQNSPGGTVPTITWKVVAQSDVDPHQIAGPNAPAAFNSAPGAVVNPATFQAGSYNDNDYYIVGESTTGSVIVYNTGLRMGLGLAASTQVHTSPNTTYNPTTQATTVTHTDTDTTATSPTTSVTTTRTTATTTVPTSTETLTTITSTRTETDTTPTETTTTTNTTVTTPTTSTRTTETTETDTTTGTATTTTGTTVTDTQTGTTATVTDTTVTTPTTVTQTTQTTQTDPTTATSTTTTTATETDTTTGTTATVTDTTVTDTTTGTTVSETSSTSTTETDTTTGTSTTTTDTTVTTPTESTTTTDTTVTDTATGTSTTDTDITVTDTTTGTTVSETSSTTGTETDTTTGTTTTVTDTTVTTPTTVTQTTQTSTSTPTETITETTTTATDPTTATTTRTTATTQTDTITGTSTTDTASTVTDTTTGTATSATSSTSATATDPTTGTSTTSNTQTTKTSTGTVTTSSTVSSATPTSSTTIDTESFTTTQTSTPGSTPTTTQTSTAGTTKTTSPTTSETTSQTSTASSTGTATETSSFTTTVSTSPTTSQSTTESETVTSTATSTPTTSQSTTVTKADTSTGTSTVTSTATSSTTSTPFAEGGDGRPNNEHPRGGGGGKDNSGNITAAALSVSALAALALAALGAVKKRNRGRDAVHNIVNEVQNPVFNRPQPLPVEAWAQQDGGNRYDGALVNEVYGAVDAPPVAPPADEPDYAVVGPAADAAANHGYMKVYPDEVEEHRVFDSETGKYISETEFYEKYPESDHATSRQAYGPTDPTTGESLYPHQAVVDLEFEGKGHAPSIASASPEDSDTIVPVRKNRILPRLPQDASSNEGQGKTVPSLPGQVSDSDKSYADVDYRPKTDVPPGVAKALSAAKKAFQETGL